MYTPLNQMTVTLKLKRIDLCDLLIACRAVSDAVDQDNSKWDKLHDKLDEILKAFDESKGY